MDSAWSALSDIFEKKLFIFKWGFSSEVTRAFQRKLNIFKPGEMTISSTLLIR